jgi:hypothetical protein
MVKFDRAKVQSGCSWAADPATVRVEGKVIPRAWPGVAAGRSSVRGRAVEGPAPCPARPPGLAHASIGPGQSGQRVNGIASSV